MNKVMAFQRVGLTIAALICSIAFLIQSTNPATADAAPNTINETGRYGMQFTSVFGNSSTFWYILVWDTTTGRSKMYYGSTNTKKIDEAGPSYQLPGSPL